MSKDLTTCCAHKRKPEKKTTVQVIKQKPGPKRRSESPLQSPPAKKSTNILPASAILNGLAQKPSSDVVCTPDIASMIADMEGRGKSPETSTRPINPAAALRQYTTSAKIVSTPNIQQQRPTLVRTPTIPTPNFQLQAVSGNNMPMVLNQASLMQQIRPSPVYHTINGFRIDLNSAAQQDTFRLPNGKLIQVRARIWLFNFFFLWNFELFVIDLMVLVTAFLRS